MTAFLIIGAIGLVVVLVAILLGDVIEGLLHIDFLDGDLFSAASIAAFVGAFGFGGAIALSFVPVMWIAVVAGLVAGGLAGWGAAWLTRWLKQGENHGLLRPDALIGAAGRVITDIPDGGYGEVRIHAGGQSSKRAARSTEAIPAGTEVWVTGVVSPTAVEVTRVREDDPKQLS